MSVPSNNSPAPPDDVLLRDIVEKRDRCAKDALMERYFPFLYWFPREAMGAPEEVCAEFLEYALEKIEARQIIEKFDSARGVKFRTFLTVVLKNLYLDFVKCRAPTVPAVSLEDADPQAPEPATEEAPPPTQALECLQTPCRVLFKLLTLTSHYLSREDVQWIAEESGRRLLDVMRELQAAELRMLRQNEDFRKLAEELQAVFWWKNHIEERLALAQSRQEAGERDEALVQEISELKRKYEKRCRQHAKLLDDFRKNRGLPTMPYKELSKILGLKIQTVGARLTRCRTELLQRLGSDT